MNPKNPTKLNSLFGLGKKLPMLALGAFLLTSCNKEYFEMDRLQDGEYSPTFAFPLIKSTVTVPEVLDKFDEGDVIVYTGDGMLALRYYSTVFSQDVASFFVLPDFTTNPPATDQLTVVEIATLAGSNVTHGPSTLPLPLPVPAGSALNSIVYKGGTVSFTINQQMNAAGTATVNIPELSGGPFTLNFAAGSAGQTFSFPLAGRVLTMSTPNTLNPALTITYNAGGTALPTDQFQITMSMTGQQFASIGGDLGQQSFTTGLDSVRVKIYQNSTDGSIFWEEPKMKYYFYNSFGAGVSVNMTTFEAISELNSTVVGITGFPNPLNIGAAPTPGSRFLLLDSLTTGNSNIAAVTNGSPGWIRYNGNLLTNPGTGPFVNFALDTSRIQLDMELFLPFHGRAVDFTKADTSEFDLSADTLAFENPLGDISTDSLLSLDNLEFVEFRLGLDNGFPIEGTGQVYFTDSNYVIIDSLITDPAAMLVTSAPLGASGRVTGKTSKITDIVVDQAKLKKLSAQGCRYLIAKGEIETSNGGNTVVKIYNDYTMDIRLSMRIKAKMGLDF